jgi:23S rRNA (uracil1939-C5)-methyltransferase
MSRGATRVARSAVDDYVPSVEELLTLSIDSLAYGGQGVARSDRGVVLVGGVVPGDVVRARVVDEKKGWREAELVEVLEPSRHRRTPPCPWQPECGGCPWQPVDYTVQLRAKEAAVRDALVRIGGFPPDAIDVRPIVPSREWDYRHRVNLRVDGEQRLGYYRHRSHRLVEIDECRIADETVNRHLAVARDWLRGVSTEIRRVEIASAAEGRAVFVANAEGAYRHDGEYHERFLRTHPTVRGVVLFGSGWRRAFGDPAVALDVGEGITIETRGGFTQVNPEGNRALVREVLAAAEPRSGDRVLDLYCGAGNLTVPLARRVRETVGVESDPQALADARRNADRHGLGACRFLQQEAAAAARGLAAEGERFDVVVLDPPRSGAAGVVPSLASLTLRRVVYVSCDPTTLARDLGKLAALDFELGAIQPIDLFPQTYHVETVVRLDRR